MANRTGRRELLIAALLTEPSIEAAAAAAGVAYRTAKSWLADPGFVGEYRAARRQLVEAAVGRMQQATAKAVQTLTMLLDCGHAPTQARAAIAILDLSSRAVEMVDLVERVEALERRAGRAGPRGVA